ncbi:hypothetical protein AhaeINNSZ174_01120 [Acinetobacter haemolyticus]|uniref:Uncharacterized protein n=1 Tax=Acinetobacter haemolyticus TaxID=29430 RepID=A0A3Q8XIG7_ACIHA|nr:hypothetical protein DX910_03970 [Acinetobacter haemolyticus]QBQ17768.1 hypothetical protein AHTJR_14840 [Acinetobacter haemolyticus]QHI11783.1 hypothetical protein AhaeAN59_15900 [Acinetobacter haemolyticus]QHI15048.1 hypothetical protein AhaeAN43_15785 [Acinetobacter haemolyticus]QHI31050.1 hypothetical protein AhaeINNSZ174_01120 [Acinetobacter haemolyticus]
MAKNIPIKNDEFYFVLAYTENPLSKKCTSMSSGCCHSALIFYISKKNVLAANADLFNQQIHADLYDSVGESHL